MAEPKTVVGALIFRKEGFGQRYLLATRLSKVEIGRFSVPGGGVEPGESLEMAISREVWEEAELEVPEELWEKIYEGRQVFSVSDLAFMYHGFRVRWKMGWGSL